jgi:phospholipase C
MKKVCRSKPLPWVLSLCGALGLALAAPGAAAAQATGDTTPDVACTAPGSIQHVIYLIKENRTFDNYFGTFPHAAGATTAVDSSGQTVPLAHADDTNFGCDIDHSWQGAHNAYNCGAMDKFDLLSFGGTNCDRTQPPPYTNHSLTQFVQADIPNYWAYAQHFTLGDHMFSSLMGPSYPNHLYTVAAQSGGPATGMGAINNPFGGTGTSGGWGCDVMNQMVQTYPFGPPLCPANKPFGTHSSCWSFPTLPEEIEAAGTPTLDWRYYAPQPGHSGYIWSALNAFSQIRNDPTRWAKVVPYTQFFTDLTNSQLPAVSWIVLPGNLSEHAPSSVCVGENYTVNIVTALMHSSAWCTSALFVTWDDFGGFYDHFPPPNTTGQNADSLGPGFRVPLLVISPFAKPGFIDTTPYDFSSMVKFAELTFGLAPLTARDLNSSNMLNAFNFNRVNPRLFLTQRTCPPSTAAAQSKSADDFDDD